MALGGIADEAARDDARSARRAVNARLEALLPVASELQKKVLAARRS